ncbi:MAG: hypothetical protein RMI91_09875 [Gemmatales bacterium]|nr:hypothetical protein [Gemmatales bacterium]MDW7994948.1 hypothetical protein [Gemmatales bacterium]
MSSKASNCTMTQLAEVLQRIQDPNCPQSEAFMLFEDNIAPIVEEVAQGLRGRLGPRFESSQVFSNPSSYIWEIFMKKRAKGEKAFEPPPATPPALVELIFRKWIRKVLINLWRAEMRARRGPKKLMPLTDSPPARAPISGTLNDEALEELLESLKELTHIWPRRSERRGQVDYLGVCILKIFVRVWKLNPLDSEGRYVGEVLQSRLLADEPELAELRIVPELPPLRDLLDAVRQFALSYYDQSLSTSEFIEHLSKTQCKEALRDVRWRQWLRRARCKFDEVTSDWDSERRRVIKELLDG